MSTPPTITNGYVTLQKVKQALRITDNIDDAILALSIEAASREIDGFTERQFFQTTTTRVFIPRDSFTVEIDDLTTLTSLKTASIGKDFDITWTPTDYQLEPLNSLAGGIPSPATRIRAVGDFVFPTFEPRNVNHYQATVQVTGTFGWPAVPTAVEQAALLLTLRQYKRYDAPLGVAGIDDLGVAMRVGRIDPDVEKLLSPFRKLRMA
jgi:hypothetical protein